MDGVDLAVILQRKSPLIQRKAGGRLIGRHFVWARETGVRGDCALG